jgi:hypothetical protein
LWARALFELLWTWRLNATSNWEMEQEQAVGFNQADIKENRTLFAPVVTVFFRFLYLTRDETVGSSLQ